MHRSRAHRVALLSVAALLLITAFSPMSRAQGSTGACCGAAASCVDDSTEATCSGIYVDRATCAPGVCPYGLTPFVDELPIPPVAQPLPSGEYNITMLEFAGRLHRDLPLSRLWGYDGMVPGPTIEARSNQVTIATFHNQLRYLENGTLRTTDHFATVSCLHGPNFWGDTPRTIVHLHGTHSQTQSDGNPDFDYAPGQAMRHFYSNEQLANTLWYHDHALGRTRTHVYMGLAAFYLLRDDVDDQAGLPSGRELDIPLMIADRSFDAAGQLFYPDYYVESFFGHYMTVNGKVQPYKDVVPSKYRLRLLNACNHRRLVLQLVRTDLSTEEQLPFQLVAADHGLLTAPRQLTQLPIVVSERYEIVADFSALPAGATVELRNVEDPADSSPAGGVYVGVTAVMQFRVVASITGVTPFTAPVPSTLRISQQLTDLQAAVPLRRRFFDLRFVSGAGCGVSKFQLGEGGWDKITALPELGTTEIWEFENAMSMVHPIHVHLVPGILVERRDFLNRSIPLDEWDRDALKDVWAVPPGQRVFIKFFFYGNFVGRFAYHCHLLEHEDHEMMRQMRVHHRFSDCNQNGICEANEDCISCYSDCKFQSGAYCGNGLCEAGDGEDCNQCPQDCGSTGSVCCGAGTGNVLCADDACTTGGWHCRSEMRTPACCGDAHCEGGETFNNCGIDCNPSFQPSFVSTTPSAAPGSVPESDACVVEFDVDGSRLFTGLSIEDAEQILLERAITLLKTEYPHFSVDRLYKAPPSPSADPSASVASVLRAPAWLLLALLLFLLSALHVT